MWILIGIIAACLTTFAFVPQIIKVRRTRSVRDVSIITLLQFSLGVSLWLVYGIYRKDIIIIAANAVSLVTLTVLIYLYSLYRTKR